MFLLRARFVGILIALMSALPALAEEVTLEKPAPSWTYEVEISGALADSEKGLIEQSSRLLQMQEKPPVSLAALRRRVQEDTEGFDKVLRSEGYYAGKIESRIDPSSKPVLVTFAIDAGPRYLINRYQVVFKTLQTQPGVLDPAILGIAPGMPARSETVVAAQKKAIAEMKNRGFPAAKFSKQDAIVDYATNSMDVTLTVESGPLVRVGTLQFEGLEEVNPVYLKHLADWRAGLIYNRASLERVRKIFLETGLFNSVRYQIRPDIGQDMTVPAVFIFAEKDHRSIGVGASWSTSEGAGTTLYWENRNFFSNGEKVRVDLDVSEIRQELSTQFVKPNFLKRHQTFKAEGNLKHEDTDAYTEDSARVYIGLDRRWRENWLLGVGGLFEFSSVEEDGETEDFMYLGLPLTARYDNTDDLLDPSRGFRLSGTLTPYLGLNDVSSDFLSAEIEGSGYYELLDKKRLILAARGKIGSILGDSTSDIPAVKRFYAGGGGSVRGYEFQSVGPQDPDGDPNGGRSVLEVGFETRIRITETIGLVPFVEGGAVYDDESPDFSEEFLWAAGLGARYYTPFGPLRFDVGVPLNPRSNDDSFQFYISIGQAF